MIISNTHEQVDSIIIFKEQNPKISISAIESKGRTFRYTITDSGNSSITIDEAHDLRITDLLQAVETKESNTFIKVISKNDSLTFIADYGTPQQITITSKQYKDFLSSLLFVEKTINEAALNRIFKSTKKTDHL